MENINHIETGIVIHFSGVEAYAPETVECSGVMIEALLYGAGASIGEYRFEGTGLCREFETWNVLHLELRPGSRLSTARVKVHARLGPGGGIEGVLQAPPGIEGFDWSTIETVQQKLNQDGWPELLRRVAGSHQRFESSRTDFPQKHLQLTSTPPRRKDLLDELLQERNRGVGAAEQAELRFEQALTDLVSARQAVVLFDRKLPARLMRLGYKVQLKSK